MYGWPLSWSTSISFLRRSSSGSRSSTSASSSIACSNPNVPSMTPGARKAFEKPRFSFTGKTWVRTLSQRYSVDMGTRTGKAQPLTPMAMTRVPSIATSVPSRFAPIR